MNKPETQAPAIRAFCVYVVLVSALCTATPDLHAGTFTFSKYCNSEGKNCSIEYSGRIENADIDKLRRVLKDAENRANFNRHIHLNSKGGDLNAALELGKLIRSHDLITFVLEECFSSCVIAFAGGVWRNVVVEAFGMPLAKIGIHRPFSTGHATSVAERRKEFNTLAQSVKTFLREGGVAETLWDDMVKTPPENMRLLNQEDVIHYGLLGKDPAYADYVDSQEAKRYGISKTEYLKRKAMIKELCDSDPQVLGDRTGKTLTRCREDVFRGRVP
jgi:hypothetical protein